MKRSNHATFTVDVRQLNCRMNKHPLLNERRAMKFIRADKLKIVHSCPTATGEHESFQRYPLAIELSITRRNIIDRSPIPIEVKIAQSLKTNLPGAIDALTSAAQ